MANQNNKSNQKTKTNKSQKVLDKEENKLDEQKNTQNHKITDVQSVDVNTDVLDPNVKKEPLDEAPYRKVFLDTQETENKKLQEENNQLLAEKQKMEVKSIEAEKNIQSLKEENENLQKRIKNIEKDKEIDITKQTEKANQEKQEAEEKCKLLEKEVSELKKTISRYSEDRGVHVDAENFSEGLPTSKGHFIIQLYPGENEYHGKIMHPDSEHEIPLHSLEGDPIVNFIKRHLPYEDEIDINLPDVKSQMTNQFQNVKNTTDSEKVKEKEKLPKISKENVKICNIQMFQPSNSNRPTLNLTTKEQFSFQTTFRLLGEDGKLLSKNNYPFNLVWFINNLDEPQKSQVKRIEGILKESKLEYTIRSNIKNLLPGIYQTTTVLTFPNISKFQVHDFTSLFSVEQLDCSIMSN